MTHFFLSEQGQSDLCRHLDDIPEVVGALAGVLCDGYRQRISYEPKVTNGSDARPMPYDTTAQDAADTLHNELWGWVNHTLGHRGQEYDGGGSPIALAEWLRKHITSVAMTPGSEEAPAAVGQAVKQARRAARMSRQREEVFSGIRAKLDPRVAEAKEEHLNARGCVAMAAQFGLTITQRKIDYWVTHDHVAPLGIVKGVDGVRYRIFRFGDVLDLAMKAAADAATMEETA